MNRRSPLPRYGVVPLAVTAAMLLRWPLWGVLGGELAFLFLWPVVMLCAWYGGLGPGLLAVPVPDEAGEPPPVPGQQRGGYLLVGPVDVRRSRQDVAAHKPQDGTRPESPATRARRCRKDIQHWPLRSDQKGLQS